MEQSFGMNIIRSFFATIDRAVYGLIATIYEMITTLANATIISQGDIEDLYVRAYTLLGIFMLFKVTFSFVNYVINPDSFTDKTKGVQNLVRNIIIVLVLIIITPYAFNKLNEVQSAILEDDLIPRFIMGVSSDDASTGNKQFQMSDECTSTMATAASDGDFIALSVLKPFYQLESTTTDIPSGYCATGTVTPSTYLNKDIYNKNKLWENTYLVDYRFFLSTIVGIVVILLLISFCFDVAVRTIKLAFLQMIAPIPIMSYIDPASSKNGMFSKWIRQIGSTWASLFIRLFALFFAVHIISRINYNIENIFPNETGLYKAFLMVFLIIGALIFAKQVPKLIEELIPGLKLGGMQLNPFKKVANDALGGKQLLGAAAGTLGAGLGAASFIGARVKDKQDYAKDKENLRQAEQEFNAFKERADAMKARGNLSEERYNKALERKLNQEGGVNEMTKKLQDNEAKRMERFSYRAPIRAGFMQTISGMKFAFNQGKNLKFDPIEIGHQSANMRDYKDKYSISDRTMDKVTDFFGTKNESGTTSKTKEDITKQEKLIAALSQDLRGYTNAFSDLYAKLGAAEASQMIVRDRDTGLNSFNSSYDVNSAIARGVNSKDIADMKAILTQISDTTKAQHAAEKERNRLEKLRDQKPPKPGK